MMNTPMNLNPRDCPNDHSGSNRPKNFVQDYCKKYPDDQGNARIYPEDVVRPRNHKWADQTEQLSWQLSYEEEDDQCSIYYYRRAPTYGTCNGCWATGPSYQPCQECDKGEYMPLELQGYILDSQRVGKKMTKPHHTARAGLTYNAIRTDTMKFNRKAIKAQLVQDFNQEHPRWVDTEDSPQFAPHQRSYAIPKVVNDFFKECDDLLNVQHIQKQQECLGGKRNPEENETGNVTNENPRKKTFSRDMTKQGGMRIHLKPILHAS
jgi:hypothetical protein